MLADWSHHDLMNIEREAKRGALGGDEANFCVSSCPTALTASADPAVALCLSFIHTNATVEGLNPHARMTSTWLPIAMCGPVHHNSSAQSSAASDATGKLLISSSVLSPKWWSARDMPLPSCPDQGQAGSPKIVGNRLPDAARATRSSTVHPCSMMLL